MVAFHKAAFTDGQSLLRFGRIRHAAVQPETEGLRAKEDSI